MGLEPSGEADQSSVLAEERSERKTMRPEDASHIGLN